MNKKYSKKVTTHQEQLKLLKSRGLVIENEDRVLRYLNQISYYRLSAYFLPYQSIKDKFNDGITFNQVLNTYLFDRKIRLLVFDCIERIEIAIRSQLVYVLANKYNNSHWQDDKNVFIKPVITKKGYSIDPFNEFQQIITKNCKAKTPEVFIKHYKKKYRTPVNPPSWMCVELLTIGELSRIYTGLQKNSDKQDIANYFGLHYKVFASWLHSLTYVRNICAHHGRLWNRELAIKPDILLKPKYDWLSKDFEINSRVFYFISILKYLLKSANPNNNLKSKLEEIMHKYSEIPVKFMGIPSNNTGELMIWQNEPIWK